MNTHNTSILAHSFLDIYGDDYAKVIKHFDEDLSDLGDGARENALCSRGTFRADVYDWITTHTTNTGFTLDYYNAVLKHIIFAGNMLGYGEDQ